MPLDVRQIDLFCSARKEVNLVLESYALRKFADGASASVAAVTVNHSIGNAETTHKKRAEAKIKINVRPWRVV